VPSRPRPHDLRASDDDRERVAAVLAAAVADGRLDPHEHGLRLERAYSARTLGDLAGLTEDLVAADHQPIRLDHRRAVAGFMTRQSRSGRWVVPESFPVTVLFGEVVLDLREAVLQSQRVTVYATLLGGRLELIVPEGLKVELTGPGTPGSKRSRQAGPSTASVPRPTGPLGTPVIEVRTLVPGGRIKITAPRPPRRRRWPVSRRRRS
jgi:hypothetical protein